MDEQMTNEQDAIHLNSSSGEIESPCSSSACGCSIEIAAPPPHPDPNQRLFAVNGMDCAEEVGALRREVGPLVGGEGQLTFDLLAGQMGVATSLSLIHI